MNNSNCAPTCHSTSLPNRCTQPYSSCHYCQLVYGGDDSSAWTLSTSSSLTASNLAGTGRTLGNLYAYLGRHLERALSQFMSKRGFGPSCTAARISNRAQEFEQSMNTRIPSPLQDTQRSASKLQDYPGRKKISSILLRTKFFLLRRDCIRLLRYAQ